MQKKIGLVLVFLLLFSTSVVATGFFEGSVWDKWLTGNSFSSWFTGQVSGLTYGNACTQNSDCASNLCGPNLNGSLGPNKKQCVDCLVDKDCQTLFSKTKKCISSKCQVPSVLSSSSPPPGLAGARNALPNPAAAFFQQPVTITAVDSPTYLNCLRQSEKTLPGCDHPTKDQQASCYERAKAPCAFAEVVVQTIPDQATVLYDSVSKGTTSTTKTMIIKEPLDTCSTQNGKYTCTPEAHTLKITRGTYSSANIPLKLELGKKYQVLVRLPKDKGFVAAYQVITTPAVGGASVYFDGAPARSTSSAYANHQTTPDGYFLSGEFPLLSTQETHAVKVSMQGYMDPPAQNVVFNDGKLTVVNVALQKCSSNAQCKTAYGEARQFCTTDGSCAISKSCAQNTDCAGTTQPYCSGATSSSAGWCSEKQCMTQLDCTLHSPTTPFCISNTCAATKTCINSLDCAGTSKSYCTAGSCSDKQCTTNTECSERASCSTEDVGCTHSADFCVSNMCAASKTCTQDADCAGTMRPDCINSQCVKAQCTQNSDCASYTGSPYCVNRACVPTKTCVSATDCSPYKPYCNAGSCSTVNPLTCSSNTDCKDASKPYCVATSTTSACQAQKTCTQTGECQGADGLGYCNANKQCTRDNTQIRIKSISILPGGSYFLINETNRVVATGNFPITSDVIVPLQKNYYGGYAAHKLYILNIACGSAYVEGISSPSYYSSSPKYSLVTGKELILDPNQLTCAQPYRMNITLNYSPLSYSSNYLSLVSPSGSSAYTIENNPWNPLPSPALLPQHIINVALPSSGVYRYGFNALDNGQFCTGYSSGTVNVGDNKNELVLDPCNSHARDLISQQDLPLSQLGIVNISSNIAFGSVAFNDISLATNRSTFDGSLNLQYIAASSTPYTVTLTAPSFYTFIGDAVQLSPGAWLPAQTTTSVPAMTTTQLSMTASPNPDALVSNPKLTSVDVFDFGGSQIYVNDLLVGQTPSSCDGCHSTLRFYVNSTGVPSGKQYLVKAVRAENITTGYGDVRRVTLNGYPYASTADFFRWY